MEAGAFGPVHVTWLDAIARIGAATLLSLALGMERFLRRKPIDFRPFVIIAVAACALTLGMSEFGHRTTDPQLSVDATRVVSGVMTGIGFIGAGALFRERYTVYGAGSAASIWASGAIGIISGFGFLWLAFLLTLVLVLVLGLSRPFTSDYTIRVEAAEDSDDV